jgi:hypothetical protein
MKKIKIAFSDFWGGFNPSKNFWVTLFDDLNIPYEIVSDNSNLLISSCFGFSWVNKKSDKKIFWTGENWYRMDAELPQLNNKSILSIFDMVYSFDYNEKPNHYRLPLYLIDYLDYLNNGNLVKFDSLRKKDKNSLYKSFKDKKFCTFTQSNGSCEFRNMYFEQLNFIEKVDSFGSLFNNTGEILDRNGKIEKSKNYKFSLSFENSEYVGYITEKIMDAFRSDIIPIYWGGSGVEKEFNANSFINVHEKGVDKSLDVIKNMDKDFDLYWSYYNQPIISENQLSLDKRISDFKNHLENFLKYNFS